MNVVVIGFFLQFVEKIRKITIIGASLTVMKFKSDTMEYAVSVTAVMKLSLYAK